MTRRRVLAIVLWTIALTIAWHAAAHLYDLQVQTGAVAPALLWIVALMLVPPIWVLGECAWARPCGHLEVNPKRPPELLYRCDRARNHRGGHRYGPTA